MILFLNCFVRLRSVSWDHLCLFTPCFSCDRVTRSLVLCVCFVDCCLSFCHFSFSHCVVFPSFTHSEYMVSSTSFHFGLPVRITLTFNVLTLNTNPNRGKNWNTINRFNPDTFLCLYRARTRISDVVCLELCLLVSNGVRWFARFNWYWWN